MPGAKGAPRSCPAGLLAEMGLRWWRRDAAMNRTEDLDVKICKEANGCVFGKACCKTDAAARRRCDGPEERFQLEAIPRHRNAAVTAGTTIAAMMKATGWQQHSVRGFLAGVVRKRLKLKLSSKKVDGNRVYQIAGGDGGKSVPRQSKRRPS
jgi:hypothetical protein